MKARASFRAGEHHWHRTLHTGGGTRCTLPLPNAASAASAPHTYVCSSSVRADEGENRSPAPKLRPMVMIERRSRVHLRRGHNGVKRHAATRQGQRQARGVADIPLRELLETYTLSRRQAPNSKNLSCPTCHSGRDPSIEPLARGAQLPAVHAVLMLTSCAT